MRTGAEVKVGLITILAIALLIGYSYFVRGYRFMAATYEVCVIFQSARGLQRGDPVRMVGVKIGEVSAVEISPELKAEVTLTIDREYALYESYRFQIATTGIIPERFVEVIPVEDPYAVRLTAGACVDGILQPTLTDLVVVGAEVLENLNRTSRALNIVLTDQEIMTGVREALKGFHEAAQATSELAQTMSGLTADTRPEIVATLMRLRGAAEDLQAVTGEVRVAMTEGTIIGDLEETARQTRETVRYAAQISESLAELVDDPELRVHLRETAAALHETALSAKQIGEDLEVFSGELREAAPVIPRVAAETEGLVGTASAIRDRLRPPEINAALDLVYSPEAERWYPSGRFDFHTRPERFFRLGMDDIGEENLFNIQLGEQRGDWTLRYGLIRSNLGIGADYEFPRNVTLSADLFDPNNPRLDLLADIALAPGRYDLSLLLGARDLGDKDLLVGGIRFKR